jgi:hypothetical protein
VADFPIWKIVELEERGADASVCARLPIQTSKHAVNPSFCTRANAANDTTDLPSAAIHRIDDRPGRLRMRVSNVTVAVIYFGYSKLLLYLSPSPSCLVLAGETVGPVWLGKRCVNEGTSRESREHNSPLWYTHTTTVTRTGCVDVGALWTWLDIVMHFLMHRFRSLVPVSSPAS